MWLPGTPDLGFLDRQRGLWSAASRHADRHLLGQTWRAVAVSGAAASRRAGAGDSMAILAAAQRSCGNEECLDGRGRQAVTSRRLLHWTHRPGIGQMNLYGVSIQTLSVRSTTGVGVSPAVERLHVLIAQ